MRQFSEEDGTGYRGASMGAFSPGQDAEIIFGEKYDNTFYGSACAYLLRRFGPSQWGCDSYKDLTQFFLTTQMDGVILTVRPGCSISTSFGYLLNPEIYKSTLEASLHARRQHDKVSVKDCDICAPVSKALCNAMEELKKPVNVRDWYFNIVGRIKDCDLQYTEDGHVIEIVEYSDLAGYGIIPEYFNRFKEE